MNTEEVRLAKLMARRGVASRRQCETLIEAGRVTVNGEVVDSPATFVTPSDAVRVDGHGLPPEPELVYYLLYKPKGYITSRDDPRGRPSVFDLVPDIRLKVEPVGRLDFDTEGALLLTNDGELAHNLTHPSRFVPKRYMAKVYRTPGSEDLKRIERGVFLEDGKTKPAKARVVEQTDSTNAWVEITVSEGRNRLIRRLFAQLGHPVSKLRRESFATLSIRGLERGQSRRLTPEEIRRIQDVAEGKDPRQAGKVRKKKGFAKAKPKLRRGKPKRLKGTRGR